MRTAATGTFNYTGGVDLDNPVKSPRGDTYHHARVIGDVFDVITRVIRGGSFDVPCKLGQRVQFELSVDESYNIEALHVRPL
jgi:hypothetical protein